MNKNRKARLLTDEEISQLSKRKDVITITINFGKSLDESRELTHKEFADFLYGMYEKYETTVIEELLFSLSKIHNMKAEKYADKIIKPELIYRITECGGCGCATANPEPPGHAVDSACFCCP